jgi:hypothetical protein
VRAQEPAPVVVALQLPVLLSKPSIDTYEGDPDEQANGGAVAPAHAHVAFISTATKALET